MQNITWCFKFAFVVMLMNFSETVKIPNYLKPCKRDADFDKCALESAKMAIQKLAKGDRKLKIPSLLPLRIPIVELNTGESFMLKIKNIKLYGLDKLKPIKFQTNFKKKTGMTLSHVEKVVILGNYDMKGKISVLPVEGQGPLNLTLVDGNFTYHYNWDLINKNGVDYLKQVDGQFDFALRKAHFNFTNLFNGNKELGDFINKFLNDNWNVFKGDLKGPITETIKIIYEDITNRFFQNIPFNDLFLP